MHSPGMLPPETKFTTVKLRRNHCLGGALKGTERWSTSSEHCNYSCATTLPLFKDWKRRCSAKKEVRERSQERRHFQ